MVLNWTWAPLASPPKHEEDSVNNHGRDGSIAIKLVLAWGFVGIPLAWGVLQTILNAMTLFQ